MKNQSHYSNAALPATFLGVNAVCALPLLMLIVNFSFLTFGFFIITYATVFFIERILKIPLQYFFADLNAKVIGSVRE